MKNNLSGTARRAAKRSGAVEAFTRAQATRRVAQASSIDECKRWSEHPNKHIRRYAFARALKLGTLITMAPTLTEFEILVTKFTQMGKVDPIKSARASLAAKAQVAQRKAQAAQSHA